jgi:DNA polymerase III subunit delta'
LKKRIFDKIVGHKATIQKMLKLIELGRVPNCMLFVGPHGQGKKLVALGVAQALNCEKSSGKTKEACGECPSCLRMYAQQSEGLILLEPEKGQIKIEQARDVIQQLSLSVWGRSRVVIINDAHLLNPQAANALLKSIEEPPPNTYFILLSTSQENVLKTLRSRSQVVRFHSLSRAERAKIGGEIASEVADEELVESAQQILTEVFWGNEQNAIDLSREKIDSKEKSHQVTQLWLEMVRDLWFAKTDSAEALHKPFISAVKNLSAVEESQLSVLSEGILLAQRDLLANCDAQLTLENLIRQYRASHVVQP